ncbi:MAG: SURF1 family protein [Nocardioidaceae bacterium]|nr:SURF1 family protein [Nocardioidaceae bacterium]NUS49877.1 SURF1 family protein [Nocardioidaceae bacterium]
MRFLFSRRWVTFFLVVVLLAAGCYLLGRWQFHRLHDRETTNSQVRRNLAAAPAPVGEVLSVGRPAGEQAEWRRITATGSYLADESVIVRYQTRDGASGVDVVTPLRTDAGPLLLVDRGWMQTDNVGSDAVRAPAPPAGQVRVVGYVRTDATGDAATVSNRSARAISSREIGPTLDGRVYAGFVDAAKETPAAAKPLVPAELPDLGNGPHFFYGLQWWFFGLLAVFGFGYLAYDERRRLRRGEQPGSFKPSERRQQMKESAGRTG